MPILPTYFASVIRKSFFSLVFIVSFFSPQLNAADKGRPNPQRDPAALDLITQSLSKMGDLSETSSGTLAQGFITYANGESKSIVLKTSGDRLKYVIGANDFSFSKNGDSGSIKVRDKSMAMPFWALAYKRADHLPSLSLMTEYRQPETQVQYVGSEDVNGQPAHHIRIWRLPKKGDSPEVEELISEFHVWIDKASLLVLRTRTFNFSPEAIQNRSPVETYYSSYKLQDSFWLPFHLTRYVDVQKDSEIELTSISLGVVLTDSDFH